MHKFLTRFLYAVIWVFSLPPLWALYLGSFVFYIFLQYLSGYRKKVIFKNIRTSFPDLTEEDVRILAKKFYKNLSQVAVESVKAMHWPVKKMAKRIKLTNREYLDEFSRSGRNIIILAGHTGNWEWLPALISPYGFDLLGVYKPQKNKVFNDLTYLIRQKDGVLPVPMRETARAIKGAGEQGKPKALLLISDQTPAKPDIHFWEDFLNQPTGWFNGGEKIARKYSLPVLYMRVIRTGTGRYEGTLVPISLEPKKEKEGEITRKYVRELEANIKLQPENWLWSHRRWKHRPEDLSLQEWSKQT